ncbi:MAG: TIGR03617 family F420-dependent LLM class oxidoreductase [Deltaproteobacteria bacterium]|nr:TIGR03617 family F420-dependent LLM class oxidoreductase [Deltaproteobacteria bacterium]
MYRVYATIDQRTPPAAAAKLARRTEAIGYDGLFVADGIHDGLLVAAMALAATSRLRVATGVLVAFPRSPMTVAHAAWDLQALSGGRFELGLGSQVRGNIVGRYGTPWTAPVPRMREYVQALRAIFACFQHGGPLCFEGEHVRLTRLQPFFNPGPIEHPTIPIVLGAVGPKMTALVGEVGDALLTHPTNSHPRYLAEVTRPRLTVGVARAGRESGDVQLMVTPLIATGASEVQLRAEREKQRRLLGFLYSTPAYWPSLELFGWRECGERLRQLTREGRWDEMIALVSDEMLDTFVPTGSHADIADILRERYSDLTPVLTFPLPEDPALDTAVAQVVEQLHA